jgi:hypothetical protein
MNRRTCFAVLGALALFAVPANVYALPGPDYNWMSPGLTIPKNMSFTAKVQITNVPGSWTITDAQLKLYTFAGVFEQNGGPITLSGPDANGNYTVSGDFSGVSAGV